MSLCTCLCICMCKCKCICVFNRTSHRFVLRQRYCARDCVCYCMSAWFCWAFQARAWLGEYKYKLPSGMWVCVHVNVVVCAFVSYARVQNVIKIFNCAFFWDIIDCLSACAHWACVNMFLREFVNCCACLWVIVSLLEFYCVFVSVYVFLCVFVCESRARRLFVCACVCLCMLKTSMSDIQTLTHKRGRQHSHTRAIHTHTHVNIDTRTETHIHKQTESHSSKPYNYSDKQIHKHTQEHIHKNSLKNQKI